MADFQQHNAELEAVDAQVAALSADNEAEARTTSERLGLEFIVAYGLDAQAVSHDIGCYTGTRHGRPHVQPASFVLDTSGRIVHAVYSSGNVGRFTASDALTVLRAARK